MLDVLIPFPATNQHLVPDCVEQIIKHTEIPWKIILVADGGTRRDLDQVTNYFETFQGPWQFLHNNKLVGLNRTITEGLEHCTQPYTMVVGPQVRLDDQKWFAKVRQIFERDPRACVIDTSPDTKSATLYPVQRAQQHAFQGIFHLAVLRTAFAKAHPTYGKVDPLVAWSKKAMQTGGSSWAAPGVRYHLTEHREHELWREPSGSKSPSA